MRRTYRVALRMSSVTGVRARSVLIDNVHCNVAPDRVGAWIVSSVSAMAARYGTASPQDSKIIEAASRVVIILLAAVLGCCVLIVWVMKTMCHRPAPPATSYESVPIMVPEEAETEQPEPRCVRSALKRTVHTQLLNTIPRHASTHSLRGRLLSSLHALTAPI